MRTCLVLQSNVIIVGLLMITGHVKTKEFQVGKCLFVLKSLGYFTVKNVVICKLT
jgi:hypothetical protein